MTSITTNSLKNATKTEKQNVKSKESVTIKLSEDKKTGDEIVSTKGTEIQKSSLFTRESKRMSFTDYSKKQLANSPLFQQVLSSDNDSFKQELVTASSFLITGFGMRNLKSFQDALHLKERKRLAELYEQMDKTGAQREEEEEGQGEDSACSEGSNKSTSSSQIFPSAVTFKSVSSSTEIDEDDKNKQKLCLEYLLGLENAQGEAEGISVDFKVQTYEEEASDFKFSKSKAMKRAQLYLMKHRIFDFFQYIAAHLLGASPENPITFIMEFLNKCLLYRSRLGKPPILYEKQHLERLFHIMDRLNGGCIDMNQYAKGITSLGICDFNENPRTNGEGCIPKNVFVEEAYNAQLMYFNELIKVRQLDTKQEQSSSSFDTSTSMSSGSYFMPSGLFSPLARKVAKEDTVEN